MDLAQCYDTTLSERDSGLAVRVITIPRMSMAPYVHGDLMAWAPLLGLTSVAFLESEEEMVTVLASTLAPSDGEARRLARVVIDEPRIPFANGAVRLLSLGQIARSAHVPLAEVVSLVSSPDSRLLLIAVPEGVTICGSAPGMAAALENGLSGRIREVMGLDGKTSRSTGPSTR